MALGNIAVGCLTIASTLSGLGCAEVPSYARGRLAHPTMRMQDMSQPAEEHVHAVHEGASGGTVGASSGCGCN
jgi:Domain of unknown function (DUF4266)